MESPRRIKKAVTILRNEGPIQLGKKTARFSKHVADVAVFHTKSRLGAKVASHPPYVGEMGFLANSIFQIDQGLLDTSKAVQRTKFDGKIRSATWFVPWFNHLAFGGIQTIFRFIEYFAKQGVEIRVVIYDKHDIKARELKKDIVKQFPGLSKMSLVLFNAAHQRVEDLPPTDVGFATKWESSYFLLRFNQTKRKYYFIQDYEPLFYAGGSTYALAESTYRFGFTGVVNTPGLLYAVNQRHGLNGVSFVPAVDSRYYYPAKNKADNKRVRIFFYARPNNPRNAFELGVLIIHQLTNRHGDAIEVVVAGSEWNEAKFGLKGKVTNMGLLKSLKEVGELYRSCDIGFCYMLSKHPSYQPFEFMASGVATVSNNNEDNTWFLKDNYNCLLAEPSPTAMAEKISILVEDAQLRAKIAKNGLEIINTDWDSELKKIWAELTKKS